MAKLWDTSGGTGTGLDPMIEKFLSSISFDNRLLPEDLEGSIAHAEMLGETGILPKATADELVRGLEALAAGRGRQRRRGPARRGRPHLRRERAHREDGRRRQEPPRGPQPQRPDRRRHPPLAQKALEGAPLGASRTRSTRSASWPRPTSGRLMPGYTHLQRAQPVTFAHHLVRLVRRPRAGLRPPRGRGQRGPTRAPWAPAPWPARACPWTARPRPLPSASPGPRATRWTRSPTATRSSSSPRRRRPCRCTSRASARRSCSGPRPNSPSSRSTSPARRAPR